MADKHRSNHGGATGSTSKITCRNCGCLNFSHEAVCDNCRQRQRQHVTANSARTGRPALPFFVSPRNAQAAANGETREATISRLLGRTGSAISQPHGHVSNATSGSTGVRINPPGSSVGDRAITNASRPASAGAGSSHTTTSSTGGLKRRRMEKITTEIIDLISSDEDGDGGSTSRPSKPPPSRLALRVVEETPQDKNQQRIPSAAADQDTERQAQTAKEPFMSRSFDDVAFRASDFPPVDLLRTRASVVPPVIEVVDDPEEEAAVDIAATQAEPLAPVVQEAPTQAQEPSSKTVDAAPSTADKPPEPVVENGDEPKPASPATSPDAATAAAESVSKTVEYAQIPIVLDDSDVEDEAKKDENVNGKKDAVAKTSHENGGMQETRDVVAESASQVGEVVQAETRIQPVAEEVPDQTVREEVEESHESEERSGLFQSRVFEDVEFNALDFATLADGLRLARRTGPSKSVSLEELGNRDEGKQADSQDKLSQQSSQADASPASDEAPSSTRRNRTSAPAAAESAVQQEPGKPANMLTPRKKVKVSRSTNEAPSSQGNSNIRLPAPSPASPVVTVKQEVEARKKPMKPLPPLQPIVKPALGQCSADFLSFMRDCVDGDVDAHDDDELARAKLLEVVDLTHLSDDSDEEDEYEDVNTTSRPLAPAPTTSLSQASSILGPDGKPKRVRPPRPTETCVLCEEKCWIKSLIHCDKCKKYYHKRCARDYGDETVCWNCDLDGMIDDTELTEGDIEHVVGMFSSFRQSPDGESPDDEASYAEEDEPEERASAPAERAQLGLLQSKTTKSMRRWKQFLEVTTAPVDETFEDTTRQITTNLQDEQRKALYSKGFTSKETVEAALSEVIDHYAELQDKDERIRAEIASSTSTSTSFTVTSTTAASAAPESSSAGMDSQPKPTVPAVQPPVVPVPTPVR